MKENFIIILLFGLRETGTGNCERVHVMSLVQKIANGQYSASTIITK